MKPVFPPRRLSFYEIEALFLSDSTIQPHSPTKSSPMIKAQERKYTYFIFIPPITVELNLNFQGAAWVYLLLGAAGQPGDACYQVV